ncbi:MAG: hypothetical protein CO013_01305 [Syntrophobacterales bacterium CG_4_8_14_3_um_filter_58_8]|nr:MAG: hypothetical protein CO013_01305 [Syntrophobacterales bacterium CG_4_8_14_3_um_filter_58_8]
MKSSTLPSFWETYRKLDPDTRQRARKAYRLWVEDSFHPSLRFKCINHEEGIWSIRITLGVRALGVLDGDTVTWFWVGDHDDYRRYFG